MNRCLWCDEAIVNQFDWLTFFTGGEHQLLCEACLSQLETIRQPVCKKCFKMSKSKRCTDCKRWERFFSGDDPLEKNVSSFRYNEFLQEMIAKWKYRGDYVLGSVFEREIKRAFKFHYHALLKEAVIVPIPLSKSRMDERGFNQSEAIAEMATDDRKKIVQLFERIDDEKQAKKTRAERIFAKNPFKLLKTTNKTVILVDDIYTTGTTLRHAARLLKASGCPAVYAYTLVRG